MKRRSHEPAPDERVAALLAAAAAQPEPEPGPVPGEAEALAAFRAAQQTPARRPRMLSSLTPLKTAAAAAMGTGLLLTGGVAAAATGSLPGAAQDTARDMLAKVGVSVPGADEQAGGHTDQRGTSDSASGGQGGADHAQSGKGAQISDLAKGDATGVDKGALVSGTASDGHSQAGRHGSATAPDKPAQGGGDNARVDTPNKGGTDRPDSTSSNESGGTTTLPDAAHSGADTADGASGGQDKAGVKNAP